jgi:DNA polymerase III alpha subunit
VGRDPSIYGLLVGSFNRPHASGYSVQAYQDAWLKVHYPFEFYAVLLTLEDEKTPRALRESRHFGVSLEAPDVNRSGTGFTIDYDAGAIRYGLIGIDGVGNVACQQIVEKAPYESLEHFGMSHSFKYSKVNKGHRQALLEAGALDSLGGRADWTDTQKAATELQRLGMALRPGATFGEDEELVLRNVYSQDEFEEMKPGDRVVVAGIIMGIRATVTKRGRNPGQAMGMVRIKLGLDEFHLTFFPAQWASAGALLQEGNGIIVDGSKDTQEKIIVKGAMSVDKWIADTKTKAAA